MAVAVAVMVVVVGVSAAVTLNIEFISANLMADRFTNIRFPTYSNGLLRFLALRI